MTKLAISCVCKAFDIGAVVGTKVRREGYYRVIDAIHKAVEAHVPGEKETPGQHFIPLPTDVIPFVVCGTGAIPPKDVDPDPFVVREWRGEREEFLRREYACETTGVAAVVYTKEAYLANDDPDLTPEEKGRIRQQLDRTHVLVALLAYGGPPPRHTLPSGRTLGLTSPTRLEANIAGANDDFKDLTEEELAEIRQVNTDRWNAFRTVAD